jgi:Ni,Fe-hydrogenase III small subunit/Pyruvate/2-oxoacid:ferredoxin oxidoreductase delta subunit
MIRILMARFQQKHRTMSFPDGPPPDLPDRFRGKPEIDAAKCLSECASCQDSCPTEAIVKRDSSATIDLGKCLFCTDCVRVCAPGAITFTKDYRLATDQRQQLVMQDNVLRIAQGLQGETRRLFGRSLKLRQVSAGGCNACEMDLNVLNTVGWDLGRFGVQFVASPRHADGLLVTGAISENMKLALHKTFQAVADPKIVIAVGACAISGGPFAGHPEVLNGLDGVLPVDLYIPGCPPHPITILDGLLRLLGRLER